VKPARYSGFESMQSARRDVAPPWALPRPYLVLGTLLFLAFLLRVFVALHSPNLYYPDEIFQSQEIGHKLAFGNGVIAWEWRDGIRSYVVPFVLSILMRLTAGMGAGSSGYLAAIAIATSALSLAVVWFCFEWARRATNDVAGLIAGVSAAIWFLVLFFSPKTFTEVLATDFLLPGILIGAASKDVSRKQLLFSGLLLGTAAALRLQFAPVVLFVAAWICWPNLRERLPVLAGAILLPILIFGMVDAFTLGYPFASFVRYFWVNVGEGKSKQFGTEPWSFFVKKLVLYCWPFLVPAFFGLRRSPLLGWVLLILVGSHSLLAHKEFRFIYAAIPLIITLFGVGCAELAAMLRAYVSYKVLVPLPYLVIFFVATASWLMGTRFTHWHDSAGELATEDLASRDAGVCGLGIYGRHWAWTGGYTHIHRRIPTILPSSASALQTDASQFNVLLTLGPLSQVPPGFSLVSCNYGACTYRRPGLCQPAGDDEINTKLKRIGQ
jgi:GPI mannosyltransferase 3